MKIHDTQLKELLELASKATNPWKSVSAECPECDEGWAALTIYNGNKEVWSTEEDRYFLAAANPEFVTALINRLKAAEEVIGFYGQCPKREAGTEWSNSVEALGELMGDSGMHSVTWEPLIDLGDKARSYFAEYVPGEDKG